MKPCQHRTLIPDSDNVLCSNHVDLIHSGTLPRSICEICPYASVPGKKAKPKDCDDCGTVKRRVFRGLGDVVASVLSAVGITKPRVQAVASAVGIADCGCDGRQNLLNQLVPFGAEEPVRLQFVWCYWHDGANGDEIRWSIRSVEQFFRGIASIMIIGDRPPWYTGPLIPKPRIKTCPTHAFRDMLSKMHNLALNPDINERFVWMMDDIYFVRPFTLADIEQPRAERWSQSRKNSWTRLNSNTMEALSAVSRTNHDYATHMPHVVDKEKLKQIIGEFNLTRHVLLWEVLYGNTFRGQPIRTKPFFTRIRNTLKKEQYQHVLKRATVFNHVAGAWCQGLREYLMELLPECSLTELPGSVSMQFVRTRKPVRQVKRRPAHTHRKYIERQEAIQ